MKIAVVQAAPELFNLERTLAKVDELSGKGARHGAGLLLFPESFIPAYPRGLGFGTVVGSRSDKGRQHWLAYWKNSISIPGPAVDALGAIARNAGIHLVIGVTERDASGHTLYCSILYFDPEGKLIGRHRKIKATGAERIIWGEGRGDDLQVMTTPFGRIGGLICWENYMPQARLMLYGQGIEIYLAPTADARDSWQATLRHIACEGRCFVLGCNQYVTRDMYPEELKAELPEEPQVMCRGGSAVINPYGDYIAGPLYDREDILFAEIDPEEIIKAKMDLDVCGHYSRPDMFGQNYNLPKES